MSESTTHFGYQSIPTKLKTSRVAEVFHSVANRYDLMNDLMSFGLHRLWKRIAIARAQIQANHHILDLACGTGDLSRLLAEKVINQRNQGNQANQRNPGNHGNQGIQGNHGRLCLTDINDSMLSRARDRLHNLGLVQGLNYIQANAESLPFPSLSFDRVLIGFGLRNVTDKEKALGEMYRVLKPGGRVIILEFSHPDASPLKTCYDAYSFSVLPKLGKWVCNDEASYRYLAESIRMHPRQEELKLMLETAAFEQVSYQNILNGIVALHIGHKF